MRVRSSRQGHTWSCEVEEGSVGSNVEVNLILAEGVGQQQGDEDTETCRPKYTSLLHPAFEKGSDEDPLEWTVHLSALQKELLEMVEEGGLASLDNLLGRCHHFLGLCRKRRS